MRLARGGKLLPTFERKKQAGQAAEAETHEAMA
jgi:hypothetical protein